MVLKLNSSDSGFAQKFADWRRQKSAMHLENEGDVKDILHQVKTRGDAALKEYTEKFDRWAPKKFLIDKKTLKQSYDNCPRNYLAAMEFAVQRVRDFHQKTYPEGIAYRDEDDVQLGVRYTPVSSAGIYIPGGKACYPSCAYMSIVPAMVAGVSRIAATVPFADGECDPLILATLHYLGIEEAYALGGAQAIAALAYGTETIKPVDFITGPGNIYVSTAKKLLFGHVGIDMLAGPTEILVVSDKSSNPEWIALDLLAQAEHDPMAQAILLSPDPSHIDAVEAAIAKRLPTLTRRKIIEQSWERYGTLITTRDWDETADLVNQTAPEHLQVSLDDPYDFAYKVIHAGAMFLGKYSAVALGDYTAGPSHVLPTALNSRFASGLSARSFLKRTSIIECSHEGLMHLGPHTAALAEVEGLQAHMLTIMARLDMLD